MTKLVSKISIFLLAPVIFGAVCLSCLIRPMPVLAAPASASVAMSEMQQDKACAEYKVPSEAPTPVVVVVAIVPGTLETSGLTSSPFAPHDANCRLYGDEAVVDAKILSYTPLQTATAILPQPPVVALVSYDQNTSINFYKIKPDKTDFITGCVIKLE